MRERARRAPAHAARRGFLAFSLGEKAVDQLAESELGRLALRGELEPVPGDRRGGLCAALAGVHREPLCRVLVARRRQ